MIIPTISFIVDLSSASLSESGQTYKSSAPLGLTYLDISPGITQSYSPAFFIDIRKSIIDMSEVLEWDLLRWEFTSVDTPAHQYSLHLENSEPMGKDDARTNSPIISILY